MYDQPLQLHPVYVSKYPEYGARDRYMPPPALMPLPPPQGVPGLADYNPVIAGSQYPAPANLVVQSALQGASLPSEIYQRQALDRPKGTTRRAKLSSLLHEAHREPPPEAQEYMPRGPLQYTNYANEVSMPLRRPLDEYGYQNQGYYNADVSTTSQFLQQIAKSQSVNKPSRELKVVDNLLEASSKLPDLDPAESNAANELYLLSGKKYFEKHFEKEVARDISTMYKHIDRHFPMPAKRLKPGKEVAYAPPLVQLGHGQESHLFPRAEILEVKSRLDGYWELQDREEKYKARIGSLKRKMEFLVQQEHQFTGKTETFDGHYDIQSYKRAKFDAIPEFQDPVVQLQEKFINCDELRDYEKKRLQLHSMYLKKRNFRMYIEAFKGEYNNLNKTLVHKLTNLENFFRLQREFLETNRENQEESEMFDITSQDSNKLVAGLGKGIPNDGGLQMSKINKDSGFSEPESSGASARKLRSRVNKRLKNVLDITLKNAKLENASSMNFEIENKDLISSIFEGYSSLTTAEEFFIITENDFSQYHNNPASLKKSLKNNSFNFQRFLKGTSMKRLKSQNILKGLSNDSGSEAKFSSENESSTASSTRRRVIGGGSKDDKNNRTKKPQALKGLTNEELDEDLSVIGT